MSYKTIAIRIRLKDWKMVRKLFPSNPNETAQTYFYRLIQEYVE